MVTVPNPNLPGFRKYVATKSYYLDNLCERSKQMDTIKVFKNSWKEEEQVLRLSSPKTFSVPTYFPPDVQIAIPTMQDVLLILILIKVKRYVPSRE
jgi:hypothetical protein